MPALIPTLDLVEQLRQVREVGAAFARQALSDDFRRRLQDEVEGGPFERLPEQMGPVHVEADLFVAREPMDAWPAIAELREELVRRVRAEGHGIEGLDRWWPNEAYVQRYWIGALGLSPHLDHKRFAYLVAVFTTAGSARFALCADRTGTVVEEWEARPGSLMLLRGPGLDGLEDGRRFHTVSGPAEGVRFSLMFCMNTGEP